MALGLVERLGGRVGEVKSGLAGKPRSASGKVGAWLANRGNVDCVNVSSQPAGATLARQYGESSHLITLNLHRIMSPKALLTSLRSLFVCASLFVVGTLGAATVGQPAPAFTLTDLDGKARTLSEFKGKVLVLEWVNPDCPFVKKHYDKSGNMPALQKAATADGVVWLLINSGAPGKQGDYDVAQAKAWLATQKAAATAYLRDSDGKVGNAYQAKATPHMFVINEAGTLVYNGAIDSVRSASAADIEKAENFVKAALAALKAGQPVPNSSNTPYGCGVKY